MIDRKKSRKVLLWVKVEPVYVLVCIISCLVYEKTAVKKVISIEES